MGKKDKKSKTSEQKARVAAKQHKKAVQKERKAKSKGAIDSDEEDIDIETVLEEFARKQALFLKVTETLCDPPPPRASSAFIASPSNAKELFLFGGESYNESLASFYNDLFVYQVEKDQWKQITSPNSPLPRSGHAWCRGGSGGIYLFGGEFSSPKQGTFHHYNDFWRLEPATREWTRKESKGKGPPARSGHRMTSYKHYIILFGGFQDTSQQTRYLNDLWLFDTHTETWHSPPAATMQKPDPRSSFSFHPHEHGAVLFGGYSRVKANPMSGRNVKGAPPGKRSTLKPVVHEDTYFLRVELPQLNASSPVPQVRWERRKRPANAPNPARAGATQVFHKGRGIQFGGVYDVEESEETIESEFFNQMYAFNIDRNRFYELLLRRARPISKKTADDRSKRTKGKVDEAELLRNLAALEASGTIRDADSIPMESSDDEDVPHITKLVLHNFPHRRFNAHLAVQGDVLYILGGSYEQSDREFTLDEMHAVDLAKLDGVRELYRRDLSNWGEGDQSQSEGSDESASSDEEMIEDEGGGVPLPVEDDIMVTMGENPDNPKLEEMEEVSSSSLPPDNRPYPRPFESLREFYSRTSTEWQRLIMERLQSTEDGISYSPKELRKASFETAESRWWDSREELIAEEDRQEAAGIGEVVNLVDRSQEGPGRRR